jgi:hypothetical protein
MGDEILSDGFDIYPTPGEFLFRARSVTSRYIVSSQKSAEILDFPVDREFN